MQLRLNSKFTLAIGAILTLSYGLLMFYTSILQNRLVIAQAIQQARMLHRQIQLTRQWVADHHGLFVLKTDHDHANPYLDNPMIRAVDGKIFVKRNPAMVTRELSEYAARDGFCWFRVTSLNPVNPDNRPDDFERSSLELFEKGVPEIIKISTGSQGRILRYVAPLSVKGSCLPCHARHGYQVGDIRGALSISVPIAWADKVIARNNRTIFFYGLLSVLAVALVLYILFNSLVARPIHRLSQAMDDFPATPADRFDLPASGDEIGTLSARFIRLCQRLETSQQALDTTRQQAFRAEKLAALGQLTAGIAHEINNPLAGLLNCVKTMQQEPDNRELHSRYLPLIDKGLHRIEHTMGQLLNYGRIEPLNLRKIDIDAIIRDCFDLLDYQLRRISLHLDLRLERAHCIDMEAIKQIIMNIALNAIQAMENGGTLTVTSREEDNTIILTFTDTGCGIEPDILDRIFDPFFTTKDVGEGTGLGLAVTHSLVQQLGGTIEVASIPGQGATFTISLPVTFQCPAANPEHHA